jgi:hypothetical protein
MKQAFWALAALLLPGICFAQSDLDTPDPDHPSAVTYHMPTGTTFVCDPASRYPVTEFYQFDCRGIPLADSTEAVVGSYFLFQPNEIFISFPGFSANPYESWVTQYPPGVLPATFVFHWRAEDNQGVIHTGSAHVTWHDYVSLRGWHAPKVTAFTVTVH